MPRPPRRCPVALRHAPSSSPCCRGRRSAPTGHMETRSPAWSPWMPSPCPHGFVEAFIRPAEPPGSPHARPRRRRELCSGRTPVEKRGAELLVTPCTGCTMHRTACACMDTVHRRPARGPWTSAPKSTVDRACEPKPVCGPLGAQLRHVASFVARHVSGPARPKSSPVPAQLAQFGPGPC